MDTATPETPLGSACAQGELMDIPQPATLGLEQTATGSQAPTGPGLVAHAHQTQCVVPMWRTVRENRRHKQHRAASVRHSGAHVKARRHPMAAGHTALGSEGKEGPAGGLQGVCDALPPAQDAGHQRGQSVKGNPFLVSCPVAVMGRGALTQGPFRNSRMLDSPRIYSRLRVREAHT